MLKEAQVVLKNGDKITLDLKAVRWARKFISDTAQGHAEQKLMLLYMLVSKFGYDKIVKMIGY